MDWSLFPLLVVVGTLGAAIGVMLVRVLRR
jgi:hypothetical protein